MVCNNCGNELKDGVRFCTYCGKPVMQLPQVQPLTASEEQAASRTEKNVGMIAMIVFLIVLVVVVALLAVVFFRGIMGGGKNDGGRGSRSTVAVESDRKEDDESRNKDDPDDGKADGEASDAEDEAASQVKEEDEADSQVKTDEATSQVKEEEPASAKNDDADAIFSGGKDEKKDGKKGETGSAKEDMDALFKGNQSDYILPDSSTRRLKSEDLADIADNKELLRLARNEIYARHHRLFDDEELQSYFRGRDWYDGYIEPDDFTESMLSDIERDNIKLIKEFEAQL